MGGLFIRYGLPALLIVSIIGGVVYKITSLEGEIDDNLLRISKLEHKLDVKRLEVMNRENTISSYKASNEELSRNIDILNSTIESMNSDYEKAKSELAKWENQPKEVKYKYITKYVTKHDVNYSKASCKEGLELMKSISEIKYEDL